MADDFEPIDVKGQRVSGIWVQHPGTEVPQVWEPRKGKNRVQKGSESVGSSRKSGSFRDDASFSDDSIEGSRLSARSRVKRGLSKIGLVLSRTLKTDDDTKPRSFKKMDNDNNWESQSPSPLQNVRAVNANGVSVNLVMEENMQMGSPGQDPKTEESGPESPNKRKAKGVAKSILKHAGTSARSMKHVFSSKGSKMKRAADLAVETDSSFDWSIPSPLYGFEGDASPCVSEDIVDEVEGDDFLETPVDPNQVDDVDKMVNGSQLDNDKTFDNLETSPLERLP